MQGEDSTSTQTVFATCLQAEQVPATVQDYREKLLHLRKLRHDLVQPSLPKGPFHEVHNTHASISHTTRIFSGLQVLMSVFSQVPLRYLIAMLFVNFRPLWDAVIDLIV